MRSEIICTPGSTMAPFLVVVEFGGGVRVEGSALTREAAETLLLDLREAARGVFRL